MSGSSHRIKGLATKTTTENQDYNIRKITVGEVDPTQPSKHGKVLMLLGATGSGKSTLINGFVNFIMGVQYKDKYRYKLITDEGKKSQAHSQTSSITAYTFPKRKEHCGLPFTLTIIDTPGYGDTSGLDRDKQITKQIKEFFSLGGKQGIDHLDGIGFVVQSSLARLTPTQKYIFDSILSIFGKDMGKNIFMMVTFADGKRPQILDAIKAQGFEYQQVFKFNNSALLPDEGADDDDDDSFNEMFWKMGEKSFQHFFKEFGKVRSVSLQLTKEVLKEREQLECLIQGLQTQIQLGLSKVDQLHQEERIMKLHEKDIETNKDFTYEITETRQRKIDLPRGTHTTNCLRCNMTCHDDCAYADDADKKDCCAMNSSGYCKVCPSGCYWNNHKNNPYRFELYEVQVTKTSDEIKKRYKEAESKKTQKEEIMSGLTNELEIMYYVVFSNISNARDSIARLEEIALRPNPLSEVQYIDLLIQSEEMEAKKGFTRRVQSLKEVRQQALVLTKIKDEKSFKEKCKAGAIHCWKSVTSYLIGSSFDGQKSEQSIARHI
ncbi:uncharacterized protein LOC110231237 [Exaiptasia diaphana]|uniref:Septin-type G domain-containing protein n=1 Tax=Exaiptasia diaphana TaxID=2652724 RepID=A0A913WNY5_EXADI|nr:uncharacterized protein LOC110231237 [Exaiptasia diaphana]